MCEATSKQGTVAVDIGSSSDDGIEGTTGTEFKQRPSCLRSKERRDSPHSKKVEAMASAPKARAKAKAKSVKKRKCAEKDYESVEMMKKYLPKVVSFGDDEKGDAEILVQPNANKETQDAYGQYCGIPAPQRYGFLSKEKQRKRGV